MLAEGGLAFREGGTGPFGVPGQEKILENQAAERLPRPFVQRFIARAAA